MKKIHRQRVFHFGVCLLVAMMLFSGGCVQGPTREAPLLSVTPGNVRDAAAAQSVAITYLDAWEAEDYGGMYTLLSPLSQDAISPEDFAGAHMKAANALTLLKLSSKVLSAYANDRHAEVAFLVNFKTLLLGELSRENVIQLSLDGNTWRIQWEQGLILPEMRGGNRLEFIHEVPSRGRIFDRSGAPLAAYESAIAIGVVPGEILPEQAGQVYETLAEISVYDADSLQQMVEATPDDWYLPIISLSQADVKPFIETLRQLKGVRIDEFRSRFYVDGGVAPHAVGYMSFITEDDLEAYMRLGYRRDERIGGSGLEAAFEQELSGSRGGSLYLKGPDGEILSLLAATDPVPGQSLYTTLDKTLQMRLQASLGDWRGAVVVMEVDTGRILALVSNPDFDPNAFDLTETDRSLLDSYFTDADQPLFNRATQGQYPLGSVFKTVSMSAALESSVFRPGSRFFCGHSLWVCDSVTLYDWTLGHGTAASGDLNLVEGLMRSCNPWFYHIGETLYSGGMENALSQMAFGFGLGNVTGVEIPESAGNIPDTASTCVESAQIAIGQGEILVTPLQVASYFSALANGGTLYRPALVERIQSLGGEITYSFEPEKRGELPVTEETLAAIQEGLRMVIEEPRGTGYWAMQGLEIPVSGKTGTAQTPSGNSHAWFAGYTRANDPERPDIAVVVLVENGGEGSVMAAPVFRRAVSLYFSDYQDPGGLMPWEVEPYITQPPAPTLTETPQSED